MEVVLYGYTGTINLKNSIVYNVSFTFVNNPHGTVYYSEYSLIEDGDFGNAEPGPGNLSGNPLFTDAENGDFTLSPYSPAIGAGTLTGAPLKDIIGNNRPLPAGSTPDIGAYESSLGIPLNPTLINVNQDGSGLFYL